MATATVVTLVTGASLPLTMEIYFEALSYLAFASHRKTRMTVHELLYNTNKEGVVLIRAPNSRFW
jgi:hypothetical protein